jgi:hypothetical protein
MTQCIADHSTLVAVVFQSVVGCPWGYWQGEVKRCPTGRIVFRPDTTAM